MVISDNNIIVVFTSQRLSRVVVDVCSMRLSLLGLRLGGVIELRTGILV